MFRPLSKILSSKGFSNTLNEIVYEVLIIGIGSNILHKQIIRSSLADVTVIGSGYQGGTYLLRINLSRKTNLRFGRFKQGEQIHLQAGNYLYIGSALAQKGATTLGNRISRHLSRTSGIPHKNREFLQQFFDEIGISYTKYPSDKKLYWNVDHLLDLSEAQVIGIIFIRSEKTLENIWSAFLEDQPETEVFEKGLGANDSPGLTHLQKSYLNDSQWEELSRKLPR